ncbi:MAG: hypothetical protein RBJ76_04840 [Stenomitos frigidus ULC029]
MRSLSIASGARDARSTLGFFVLVSLVLQGGLFFMAILLFGAYVGLVRKAPPSLVQLESGKTIATAPLDSGERSPAVIQRFVQDELMMLTSAVGTLPAVDVKTPLVPDPGVMVKLPQGQAKITTLASFASFGLSEDFRVAYLVKLAQLTPQGVFNQQERLVLVLQDVSLPEKVKDGQWKVTVVANLVRFSAENQLGAGIPYNREVFVRAITAPDVTPVSSELERQVAQVRASGLEIYAMRDFVRPNL